MAATAAVRAESPRAETIWRHVVTATEYDPFCLRCEYNVTCHLSLRTRVNELYVR